jgi:hypothetical protein
MHCRLCKNCYQPASEGGGLGRGIAVEGLYYNRPFQCLASSELLTPHPLTPWRVCTPPPLVRGEDTLAEWRGGAGGGLIVRKTLQTLLCTLYR